MKINEKILYLSFHNSIKKKFGINCIVPKKEIITKLGRQFLVPKRLRNYALNELINMGLLKKEGNNYLKILEGKFDLENPKDKFYLMLCNF